jgi:hypothetical protein
VLLALLHLVCPRVRLVWADGGYAGALVKTATRNWSLIVQIVKGAEMAGGLQVLACR